MQRMTTDPYEHTAPYGARGGKELDASYRPPEAVHLDSGRELHVEPEAPNGKAGELWDLDDGREPVGDDRAPGAALVVGNSFPPDERPTVRRSAAALVLPAVQESPPPGPLLPDLPWAR